MLGLGLRALGFWVLGSKVEVFRVRGLWGYRVIGLWRYRVGGPFLEVLVGPCEDFGRSWTDFSGFTL